VVSATKLWAAQTMCEQSAVIGYLGSDIYPLPTTHASATLALQGRWSCVLSLAPGAEILLHGTLCMNIHGRVAVAEGLPWIRTTAPSSIGHDSSLLPNPPQLTRTQYSVIAAVQVGEHGVAVLLTKRDRQAAISDGGVVAGRTATPWASLFSFW
jgi:hypothetical protein